MGLDMYLSAERYYWYNEEPPLTENGLPIKTVRVEAGYWRKANQIHAWFVDNVQAGVDECQEHFVSREDLSTLKDLCEKVLKDPSMANELLPPRSGFFFGGTDVDERYLKDLEHTIEVIDKCLNEDLYPPKNWDFYYSSSW